MGNPNITLGLQAGVDPGTSILAEYLSSGLPCSSKILGQVVICLGLSLFYFQ
jgi:hypothetical protein